MIRFKFHQTSFCFINCHLNPFLEEIEKRNQDFNEIINRAVFKCGDKSFHIKDHDLVYWLGDLNYRINYLTTDEVKKLIEEDKLEDLLINDQLKQQQKLKKSFVDFNEAAIGFLPTYKFDVDTDQWDSSSKNRAPAWCDRILWTGSGTTKCIEYRSHPKICSSDHKPVSALFNAQIKMIN